MLREIKRKKLLMWIIYLIPINILASEIIYEVRSGENLSQILRNLGFKNLYGKKGKIAEVVNQNKDNIINYDFIKVGQRIKIENMEDQKDFSQTELKNEVLNNLRKISSINSSDEIKISYYYKLAPAISWYKINSNYKIENQGYSIETYSKTSQAFNMELGLDIENKYRIFTKAKLANLILYPSSNYSLKSNSFLTQAYDLGFSKEISPDLTFNLSIGMHDEYQLSVVNNNIDINKTQRPEIELGIDQKIMNYKNIISTLGFNAQYIAPIEANSIKGKSGYGIGGDVNLMYKNKGLKFFYHFSEINSSNNSTKTQEIGWSIIFEEDLSGK